MTFDRVSVAAADGSNKIDYTFAIEPSLSKLGGKLDKATMKRKKTSSP